MKCFNESINIYIVSKSRGCFEIKTIGKIIKLRIGLRFLNLHWRNMQRLSVLARIHVRIAGLNVGLNTYGVHVVCSMRGLGHHVGGPETSGVGIFHG